MPIIQTISVSDIAAAMTMLGALGLFFWRLSVRIKEAVDGQKSNAEAISRLGNTMAALGRRMAQNGENVLHVEGKLNLIKGDIGKLSLLLTEREKDISRLEGQIETLSNLMLKQVSAVKEATSSLDAVWRTLQVLFPDKVPKRASDRPTKG